MDFGQIGEEAAVTYLQQQGYTILDRNWHCGHLELDIVALDGDFLSIVEVKMRDYNAVVSPFDSVDKQKQRNMVSAANGYVKIKNRDEEVRFDIVSVIHHCGEVLSVELMKDAFYPSLRAR